MDASIETLGFSAYGDLPAKEAPASLPKIVLRILASQELESEPWFDEVHLRLQGAIECQIGNSKAMQRFVDVGERRTWFDFRPLHQSRYGPCRDSFIDVQLSIPTPDDTKIGEYKNTLLPSMDLSGTTYITESTTLCDQHRIEGTCRVSYQIVADFVKRGKIAKRLCQHCEMSDLINLLPLMASASPDATFSATAKPHRRSILSRQSIWPTRRRSMETLKFEIWKDLGFILPVCVNKMTKFRSMTVPVTVSLQLPPDTTGKTFTGTFLQSGLFTQITARWQTCRTFSTNNYVGPGHRQRMSPTISKNTVVVQKTYLSFPPLYHNDRCCHARTLHGAVSNPLIYSATAMLALGLPESVSSPSIDTELLRISSELDLEISYRFPTQASDRSACYSARFHVPVSLRLI